MTLAYILSVCFSAHQAVVVKINEVCFKHAEWRFTDVDGQLGNADLVLRNFLLVKFFISSLLSLCYKYYVKHTCLT